MCLCGWESVADIPLAAFLSSANLHDSKAMIPMMQKVSERFGCFHGLADAEYDAVPLRPFGDWARVQPSAWGARLQVRPCARKQEGFLHLMFGLIVVTTEQMFSAAVLT